jgi:hypothetical protein
MFVKGKPRPPNAGRRKGTPNKATADIKAWTRGLLESEEYRTSARERILAGEAPHLETLCYHYAYGKPKDRVEISAPEDRVLEIAIIGGSE